MNDFKEIINICKKNKIKIKLYISPAHANLDGEGILSANLYEEFENWKRDISNIVYNSNLKIIDFSGYNNITTEKVKTPMINLGIF